MARKGRNPLPKNLYKDGKGYYYYRHPVTQKNHGMGKNKAAAIQAALRLNMLLQPDTDLVRTVMGVPTVEEGFEKFIHYRETRKKDAKKTLEMYHVQGRKLVRRLGKYAVDHVEVSHVATMLDAYAPATAKQLRQVAVAFWKYCIAQGWTKENPADQTLQVIYEKTRKRLTLKQYKAIHALAEPWLQNAMDLALLTLQRRNDVLQMRFDNYKDNVLYVIQEKTKKYDTGYLAIKAGPELQNVIQRCRDDLVSPFLVHRRPIRKRKSEQLEHWTQVSPTYLSHAFQELRDKLPELAALPSEQRPTFHEIRSLGIRMYEKQGVNPQVLAGHASAKMTENYKRNPDEIVWKNVTADLKVS